MTTFNANEIITDSLFATLSNLFAYANRYRSVKRFQELHEWVALVAFCDLYAYPIRGQMPFFDVYTGSGAVYQYLGKYGPDEYTKESIRSYCLKELEKFENVTDGTIIDVKTISLVMQHISDNFKINSENFPDIHLSISVVPLKNEYVDGIHSCIKVERYLEQIIFLYYVNDDRCSPIFVLCHELGHFILTMLRYHKINFNEFVDEYFEQVLKVKKGDLTREDKEEVLVDTIAMGLLYDSAFPKCEMQIIIPDFLQNKAFVFTKELLGMINNKVR